MPVKAIGILAWLQASIDLLVTHRSARLDDGCNACSGCGLDCIGKGEESIRAENGSFGFLPGIGNGNPADVIRWVDLARCRLSDDS